MEKNLEEKDKKIFMDFRSKISGLKLKEKKKAVVLYKIFEKMIKIEENRKKKNNEEYEIYNKKITEITEKTEKIVEGEKMVEKKVLENWKMKNEKDLVIPEKMMKISKIENFWKNFILNNDLYIGINDDEILDNLIKMDINLIENEKISKKIIFTCYFKKNEFFKNSELTTTLFYDEEELIKSSIGTKIDWKKNPTVEKVKKMQKNKRTGKKRVIFKEIQKRSFFEIFGNFKDDMIIVNDDEELASMCLDKLDECVNEIIDTLPYALEYYLDVRPEEEYDEKTEDFSDSEENLENEENFEENFENDVILENKGKFEENFENEVNFVNEAIVKPNLVNKAIIEEIGVNEVVIKDIKNIEDYCGNDIKIGVLDDFKEKKKIDLKKEKKEKKNKFKVGIQKQERKKCRQQ